MIQFREKTGWTDGRTDGRHWIHKASLSWVQNNNANIIYITFEDNSEYYTSENDIDMIDVIVF